MRPVEHLAADTSEVSEDSLAFAWITPEPPLGEPLCPSIPRLGHPAPIISAGAEPTTSSRRGDRKWEPTPQESHREAGRPATAPRCESLVRPAGEVDGRGVRRRGTETGTLTVHSKQIRQAGPSAALRRWRHQCGSEPSSSYASWPWP